MLVCVCGWEGASVGVCVLQGVGFDGGGGGGDVCVWVCVCMRECVCVLQYVCMLYCVCVCVWQYVCMLYCVCVCVTVCVYVILCVCVCVFIYILCMLWCIHMCSFICSLLQCPSCSFNLACCTFFVFWLFFRHAGLGLWLFTRTASFFLSCCWLFSRHACLNWSVAVCRNFFKNFFVVASVVLLTVFSACVPWSVAVHRNCCYVLDNLVRWGYLQKGARDKLDAIFRHHHKVSILGWTLPAQTGVLCPHWLSLTLGVSARKGVD